MVASAHPLASEVGAKVLAGGGNAIDAALAMAAMTAVVLPAQCGFGGDAFAVLYDAASGTYRAVQGSGVGPDGADADYFRARGCEAVPVHGPLSVAVPGMVSCVESLHGAGATRSLAELFEPAAAAAEQGVVLTAKNAHDIASHREALAADPAAAAVLLPAHRVPSAGERLVQADLARTVRAVADAPSSFYTGAIAERCVAALRAAGAPWSGEEWAAQRAPLVDTVASAYGGVTIHTTAPPSPGYMVLQQLAIVERRLGELAMLGPDAVELMARAAVRCFADRVERVSSETDEWRRLLERDAIADAAREAASREPLRAPALVRGGDTTSFVAVDEAGNAVSFIHSLAFTWGARVMVPGTGLMLNDRLGRGAYLLEGHPNCVAPRRRPMHTLNAWIAAGVDGRPLAVGNTPGGDGQVQWNVQLISHLFDHGLDPQEAVDAPRFSLAPGSDANAIGTPLALTCESRLGTRTLAALRDAGLPVTVVGPMEGGGGAQVVAIGAERGDLLGGSDSRQDGIAVGA
ncbi:MAG TPA: gamma-glutamyltransferase [Acidimicrobiales bacterium]|nr:gamma-glutamyltransferase [Acidimicrobiales bacterium]